MSAAPHDSDHWRPCPPGELHRIVARKRTHERRRVLKKLGGTAVALFVLGSGGYVASRWLFSEPAEYRYGGITCSEVMRLLPDYREKKLGAVLAEKIAAHLDECPKCGPMYRHDSA